MPTIEYDLLLACNGTQAKIISSSCDVPNTEIFMRFKQCVFKPTLTILTKDLDYRKDEIAPVVSIMRHDNEFDIKQLLHDYDYENFTIVGHRFYVQAAPYLWYTLFKNDVTYEISFRHSSILSGDK